MSHFTKKLHPKKSKSEISRNQSFYFCVSRNTPLSFLWFATLKSGVLAALVGGDLAPLADLPPVGDRVPLGDLALEWEDLVEFGDVTPELCLFWAVCGCGTKYQKRAMKFCINGLVCI